MLTPMFLYHLLFDLEPLSIFWQYEMCQHQIIFSAPSPRIKTLFKDLWFPLLKNGP